MKIIPTIAVILMLSSTVFGDEPNKSEAGARRAEILKNNLKTFQLSLSYTGQSDKPYYDLLVSVPTVNRRRSSPFSLISQIGEDQALTIIAHLLETGLLGQSSESEAATKLPQPFYRLTVTAGDLHLSTSLGWGQPMLKSLDGLRKIFDANTAKQMDTLLGRLSGHRKEWEAAAK